ncbi:hypothetical protein PJF56_17305 [Roseofilum sp. BLCC_M91]|uniref:Uncharacterized protein n=1 Tax=Roseofilum halophilum BLCC-M91 TaxID=3022259 RepID=A0ABT7BQ13_9CYAN|nr:hypothetical protein [Roseofilum halophilum]MDJ1180619.1 hypothetical protein [Roseofilum halophilum BLCC-M91]
MLVSDSLRDKVDKLSTFEEILSHGVNTIELQEHYLWERLRELKELCDTEEDYDLSLESLKTMLLFVGSIPTISKPTSLTVNENGLLHVEWQKDRQNSLTLRCKDNYFLDYVIFKPSLYIDKRTILKGSMYVLDFVDYIRSLEIKIHHNL